MTSFADVDDLRLYTQLPIDDVQEEMQAERALAAATSRIRTWTRQHIAPVTTAAIYERRRLCRPLIVLPHAPIIPVNVTGVEVDGDVLDAEAWHIDGLHVLTRVDGAPWLGHVKVIYGHGFELAPDDVSDVCLSVAARTIGNPEGIMQAKFGLQSVSFASEPGVALGLDRSHKEALEPYRMDGIA